MNRVSVLAAKAVGYTSAGTIEFILDERRDFYFIEMNTRIQVEHPVTEAVCGQDLVKMQIQIAQGEPLHITQKEASTINCHAIEHRVNAEDSAKNFTPCPGTIEEWIPAGGLGVRVDSHMYTGYTIPSYYDSLIAKLIVTAPDRAKLLERSRRCLGEFVIGGVQTTIPFHQKIVHNEDFINGNMDTGLIERMMAKDQETSESKK